MNVTFDSSTFYTNGLNFGSEYAAHIIVQNSHMYISGTMPVPGVVVGGVDSLFSGNDLHGGGITPGGLSMLFTDFYGPQFDLQYNGQITVDNNVFDCTVSTFDYCVYSKIAGTKVSNNQISATGSKTIGLFLDSEDGTVISQSANSNTVSVVKGNGIYMGAAKTDAGLIQGNTVKSSGGFNCIVVGNPTTGIPDGGSDIVSENSASGCMSPLTYTPRFHPGLLTAAP